MNKSILGSVNLQKVGAVISTVTLLVTLFTPFLLNVPVADAATVGPNTAANLASVSFSGGTISWSSPSNAQTSNNVYATTTLGSSGQVTRYLQATGFSFGIPTSSIINGIQVQIERRQACAVATCTSAVTDERVRLVKNGVVGSTDRSTSTAWGTSDATVTYGGPTDLWGGVWTPFDVNNASSGVALAISRSNGGDREAFVDSMTMTVYYTLVLASTTTSVNCPNVNFGTSTTCTATVTRVSGSNTPTGNVSWSSNAAGTFTPGTTCTLSGSGASANCSVTYTPTAFNSGSHTVTGSYGGDSNFSTSTGNKIITVSDVTKPVFGPTPNITAEASSSAGSNVSFVITASDNVDGSVTPVCTPAAGSLFPITTTSVSCTATDAHSNVATSSFNVTVQDTTKPVITLNGSATVNLNVGDSYSDLGATASDNIDGDISANVTSTGSVNTAIPGTYPINFNVSDSHGNAADQVARTVFVSDVSAPVIVPIANVTVEATGPTGATTTYGTVNATDDVDGTIPATCTPVSGSLFALGTTTVSCSATDSSSNVGTGAGLLVTVQDTTAPTLTLNGTASTTLVVGDTYTELGAIFSDLVDTTGTVTISGDIVTTTAPAVFNVLYDATDSSGNAATQLVRTVTVTNPATTTLTVSIGGGAPIGAGAIITVGSTTSTYNTPVILNDGEAFSVAAIPVIGYATTATGTCSGTATFGGPYTCSLDYSSTSFDIVASSGGNGSISPSGTVAVAGGSNQVFTITPDSGFQISDVLVDGVSVGGVSTYTFSSVVASHTIAASFSAIPPAPPSGGGGGGGGGGSITLVAQSNPTTGGGSTGGTTGGGSNGSTGGNTENGSSNGNTPAGGSENGGNTGGGLVLGTSTSAGSSTNNVTGGGEQEQSTGGTKTTFGNAFTSDQSSTTSTTSPSDSEASSTETTLLASILDSLGGNTNLLILLIAIFGIVGLIYYFSRG